MEEHEHEHEEHSLPRLILSAVLFAAVFVSERIFSLPHLVTVLLYLVPYLLCGWKTVWEAFEHLFSGHIFDEEFLMTAASLGAFCIGEGAEGAAVMLFFSLGEFLEDLSVGRTRRSVAALASLRPDTAHVKNADGSISDISPEDVSVGTKILVYAGERIPLDGEAATDGISVDASALTGESLPVPVSRGDTVRAGCVCLDGTMTVSVTKPVRESAAARILALTEEAASRKTRTERFLSRFSRVYTPAVVGGAVLLAVVPSLITGEWGKWVYRALSFLVVSCPCALVISVPLSFFCGIGAASKRGILIKGSGAVEALSRVTAVASDKTGTLTEGRFSVSETVLENGYTKERLLYLCAHAEKDSSHPTARCVKEAYGKELSADAVSAVREFSGRGVSACVDGETVLCGNGKLMAEYGISVPAVTGTVLYVSVGGVFAGYFVLADTIKPDAREMVTGLRAEGIGRIELLTGDTEAAAEPAARALGVDAFHAGLLPEDKLKLAEKIKTETRGTLLCIGDGINDAPLLAMADVGAAMGGLGSDAAMEAADVVIMDDKPARLVSAVKIAKKTMRLARENVIFALAVKTVILILGALGITNMWAAVFGDVGVTLLCVLNAGRAAK